MFNAIQLFIADEQCECCDFQDDREQRIYIQFCVKLDKSFTETRKTMR